VNTQYSTTHSTQYNAKTPRKQAHANNTDQTQAERKQKATRKQPGGQLAGWLAGWLLARLAGWLAGWNQKQPINTKSNQKQPKATRQ
jgi:hypothetical protein